MVYEIPIKRVPYRKPRNHPIALPFLLDPDLIWCFITDFGTTWVNQAIPGTYAAIEGPVISASDRNDYKLYFDGTNDRLTIADNARYRTLSAFTMCLWMKPSSAGGDGQNRLIWKLGATGSSYAYGYFGAGAAGTLVFTSINSGLVSKSYSAVRTIPVNAWNHLCFRYNGSNMNCFVNGVPGTSTAQTGTITPVGTALISDSSTDYNGYIDEVLYFRRALTAQEILTMYEAGRP